MRNITRWFWTLTAGVCLALQVPGQPANTNSSNSVAPPPTQPASADERVSLQGLVRSKEGKPLEGVLVRITAALDLNTGEWLDHESAPEVGNQTNTTADGRFSLPSLPGNRVYRLFVASDGFTPLSYRNADPKSEPMEIRLAPTNGTASGGKFIVHARILGPEGRPVISATVEPNGWEDGMDTGRGDRPAYFSELAVSDTNGEFVFRRDEPSGRMEVRIHSPGLAPAHSRLDVTNTVQTVEMGVGATIRGRVLKDGKPLADVHIGLSGSNRRTMGYAGRFSRTTGQDGTFVFDRLTPDTSWYLYGNISSLKSHGALPARLVASAGHGQVTDLGDLQVVPGLRLAGTVKTQNGEPLPKSLKMYMNYESLRESQTIEVDEAGRFALDGLFKGTVTLTTSQRDWRMSGGNRSLDVINGTRAQLAGLLEEDKMDLLIVIEQGESEYYRPDVMYLPEPDWPQSHPLSGVEASGAPLMPVAGQVVDDISGQPIAKVKIVPGRWPPGFAPAAPVKKPLLEQMLSPLVKKPAPLVQLPFMDYAREETVTNGTFSFEFVPLTSQPMLTVQAEGYVRLEMEAITQPTTNLIIRLKRGTGPNGVVLLPNGKPAENATVLYGARPEQGGLMGRELMGYAWREEGKQHTGSDGKFSFPALSQGVMLFVAHQEGWAEEPVEHGGDRLEIKLKPWASVTGTLVDSNGVPKAGVPLCLSTMDAWQHGGAIVDLHLQANTDAQGHFLFHDVPPGRLELQRMVPMTGTTGFSGGYTWQLQTKFEAEPGITNDIGKVTYDTPPPPTMLEQMKKRLGL